MKRREKRMNRGVLLVLLSYLACGPGAVSLLADTCSYTYHCGGPQCASLMGGYSGTRSQSGVTMAQCEAARKAALPYGSSPCTCTADGANPASGDVKVAVGHNLQQNMVSLGANAMVANIKNPYMSQFMSSFTNSFLQTMFDNQAEAQRQRQIIDQQLTEQRQRQQEQRRIAEEQRIDAMFARLKSELKLEGVPFGLTLKPMNSNTDLELKGFNSSGPEALKLKLQPATSTSYGLKGLPGIYVGGPAASDTAAASGDAPKTNPNLVSGPGTGTTGPGIPGLPGIYLDAAQPQQAVQLAQAANRLSGSDQSLAQDVALHAAEKNPALTGPSDDTKVQNFQQTAQQYDQAAEAARAAQEQWTDSQSRADADKSVIDMARSKLDMKNATPVQQQAFNQMLQAAKSDEDAAEAARKIFDGANASLSASRTNAAAALAVLALPPSDSSVVDLSHAKTNPIVADLKTPDRNGAPLPLTHTAAAPRPVPTQAQLRIRLEGLQEALRRLAEDEKKRGVARAEAAKDVNDAVGDAEERGLEMLFNLLTTGWDNCAPLAQGGVVGKFERDAARIPEQIEEVYRKASEAKDFSTLGSFNEKKEQLDRTKLWLEDSINQIKRYKARVSELQATGKTKEILENSNGDWQSSLEGLYKTIEMGLEDKPIAEYLEKHADLAGCHVVALKATSSAIDSVYDLFKEGDAAVELRDLDENTEKFLTAQKSLDAKLKSTVAQLNCYKLPNAGEAVNCIQAAIGKEQR
jgi:hypothetical protein